MTLEEIPYLYINTNFSFMKSDEKVKRKNYTSESSKYT